MTAAVRAVTAGLLAAYERAESVRVEAAEAERCAYQQWQDAYGRHENARDHANRAWRRWLAALA
jgi:hypothetical protein